MSTFPIDLVENVPESKSRYHYTALAPTSYFINLLYKIIDSTLSAYLPYSI